MPRQISEELTLKEVTDLPTLQEEFAGAARRVESLRGRMAEAERQMVGLFEGLLAEVFDE